MQPQKQIQILMKFSKKQKKGCYPTMCVILQIL